MENERIAYLERSDLAHIVRIQDLEAENASKLTENGKLWEQIRFAQDRNVAFETALGEAEKALARVDEVCGEMISANNTCATCGMNEEFIQFHRNYLRESLATIRKLRG